MNTATPIDTARLNLLLTELRLPAVRHLWASLCERSDKEGWPAARFLATLIEHELAERDRRRLERHLGEAKLLAGKTLATFDFEAVPMISRAQVAALCAGDAWLAQGANVILFGPPGGGKSHLSCAIGLSLLSGSHMTLFPRVVEVLRERDAADIVVFGGGIIPEDDITSLKQKGLAEIFTPGTSLPEIVRWVEENIAE